jgi:hypothetical protein
MESPVGLSQSNGGAKSVVRLAMLNFAKNAMPTSEVDETYLTHL